MTSHFVLRSTTLAAAFLLFATGAANAACSIASVSPTTDEVLHYGRGFWFVAMGDCPTLIFSVQDTALTKIPIRGPGPPTGSVYRVFLTESEWDSVVDESTTTFTWSITAYGPGRLPISQVTTTNGEIDFDDDGWTRSDGDVGECDLSSTINPGVEETCNMVDDNCSGSYDEDLCRHPRDPITGRVVWCDDGSGRRAPCTEICRAGVWTEIARGWCP